MVKRITLRFQILFSTFGISMMRLNRLMRLNDLAGRGAIAEYDPEHKAPENSKGCF